MSASSTPPTTMTIVVAGDCDDAATGMVEFQGFKTR